MFYNVLESKKMGKLHNSWHTLHYNLKNSLSKTLDFRIECYIDYFSIHLFFSPSSLHTVIKLIIIIIIIIKHLQLFQWKRHGVMEYLPFHSWNSHPLHSKNSIIKKEYKIKLSIEASCQWLMFWKTRIFIYTDNQTL